MTIRYTKLHCKVETTFTVRADGIPVEHVVLSTEPALALALDEPPGTSYPTPPKIKKP